MTAPLRGLTGDEALPVADAAACLRVSEARARVWLSARGLVQHDREGREYVRWACVISALRADRNESGPRRPQRGSGWVYFVQATPGTPIKIGYATNPDDRLASLQTGSPYRLRILLAVPGSRKHERTLHLYFYESRLVGEWFAESGPLLDLVTAWGKRGRVWTSPSRERADEEGDGP